MTLTPSTPEPPHSPRKTFHWRRLAFVIGTACTATTVAAIWSPVAMPLGLFFTAVSVTDSLVHRWSGEDD